MTLCLPGDDDWKTMGTNTIMLSRRGLASRADRERSDVYTALCVCVYVQQRVRHLRDFSIELAETHVRAVSLAAAANSIVAASVVLSFVVSIGFLDCT